MTLEELVAFGRLHLEPYHVRLWHFYLDNHVRFIDGRADQSEGRILNDFDIYLQGYRDGAAAK